MDGKRHRAPCWYDRVTILLGLAEEVIRLVRALRGL